jgi:hypothetical protein
VFYFLPRPRRPNMADLTACLIFLASLSWALFLVEVHRKFFTLRTMLRVRRRQEIRGEFDEAAARVAREFALGLLVTECVAPEFRDCAPAAVEKNSNALREAATVAHD